MRGQYSIFDIQPERKRPCDYPFKRYIGQKVVLYVTSGVYKGVVEEIETYYTVVKCKGCHMVGTPSTMAPADKEEYDEDYKTKMRGTP